MLRWEQLPYLRVQRHRGRAGDAAGARGCRRAMPVTGVAVLDGGSRGSTLTPTSGQPSTGRPYPSLRCPLAQDENQGGGRRFKHAMNFPAELMEGSRARGVEQELVCIYIHSPCIFQVSHRSSHRPPEHPRPAAHPPR